MGPGRWVVVMIIPESTMYHTLHSIYVACIMILCYSSVIIAWLYDLHMLGHWPVLRARVVAENTSCDLVCGL